MAEEDQSLREHITAELRAAGLTPEYEDGVWIMSFELAEYPGKRTKTFMFLNGSGYVLCVTPLPWLVTPLDDLDAESLRTMLRISSLTRLARVEYFEEGKSYFATSDCSVEGLTGEKVKRRLQACALLGLKLEDGLNVKRAEKQAR